MTGVVLCGGQSSRMGTDKGLLPIGNKIWAQHAADKLQGGDLPVVLSVSKDNYNSYLAYFPESMLVADTDMFDVGGPLKGVLSVHVQYPTSDLVVLAVDIPLVSDDALMHLVSTAKSNTALAVAYSNNGQVEPLCAVYKAEGLKKIIAMLQQGLLKRHSMQNVLQLLESHTISLPYDWQAGFFNCNTPEDLQQL